MVILRLLKLNVKARQDTRILDSKPFVNVYYSIGHRSELIFFLSAQFLLASPFEVDVLFLCPIFSQRQMND